MRAVELWRGLIDLAIPPLCADCRAPTYPACGAERSRALCPACRGRLPWLAESGCRLCGEGEAVLRESLCSSCSGQRGRRSPLSACTAAVAFEGEAERWIYRVKYPGRGLAGCLTHQESWDVRNLSRSASAILFPPFWRL